jgi:iron complex transport system substrate-binding protein
VTTSADSVTASAFPVTVTVANGEVTILAPPERIVSLAPTTTEMLFAVGAGDQVVAVDDLSNFPEGAPVTELSGFQPNVEAVVDFDPDLVLVSEDINEIVSSLEAVGVPVAHLPAAASMDDVYLQIEQVGELTGNLAGAQDLIVSMKGRVEELAASVPEWDEPPTYYHELDSLLFTITSDTFIGHVYELVGLVNIADSAEHAGTQYPQLSSEFIIEADPDLIFLADTKCCGESPETAATRPGWGQLTAVATGAVVPLDDDVVSRWGPRVVDFLEVIVEAVNDLTLAGS